MRPISESTARVAGKCFERKYIALGRIVKHWREIAGERLADKAQPVKLHYRKKIEGQKPQASLDIAVSSSNATLLHYQKDLILERINNIFGERWVTAIRFVNIPVPSQDISPKKIKPPLTLEQKKTLSGMLNVIEDPDIQARLNSLGEAILMQEKKNEG